MKTLTVRNLPRRVLKKAGTPLPANDLWIAAVAVRHGAPVLTYDAHFQKIPRTGATVLSTPDRA